MFILGHLGITLGIFYLASLAFPSLKRHIDYRFIAVGALLPDLIDKAIGRVLFEDVFASGRLFAHSLVFVIVILVVGYVYFRQQGDSRIMMVAGASFLHLLEDQMWMNPQTFFWPVFGWEFAQGHSYGSFPDYFMDIVRHVYSPELSFSLVSEVIGLLLVLFLVYEHRK
jgi:membrane-bound metal-dependent hydrolase YbcI (DUF457 family)